MLGVISLNILYFHNEQKYYQDAGWIIIGLTSVIIAIHFSLTLWSLYISAKTAFKEFKRNTI